VSFWDAIEEWLAEHDESGGADAAPDPWGEVEVDGAGLTDAQVAHLEGLDDQPPVPHLDGDDRPGD
jgi:hypothetical protein